MVNKRSLRSSKKDGGDAPAEEEEKPKPTRSRSVRGRKTKGGQEDMSGTDETPAAPPSQSEDVVMETESVSAHEKTSEDVEMKIADEDGSAEKKNDETNEDTTASPLTGLHRQFIC